MPSVQTTIPFTWAMARSHVRANTESLHHTQLRPVNSSSQKLMDGESQPYRASQTESVRKSNSRQQRKSIPNLLPTLLHDKEAEKIGRLRALRLAQEAADKDTAN